MGAGRPADARGQRAPGTGHGTRSAARDAWPRCVLAIPAAGGASLRLPELGEGGALAACPARGRPGRGNGDQGSGGLRAPAGPVPARASRLAPRRSSAAWGEKAVVPRAPATCRTSLAPRISCLRAPTLAGKALNCARAAWALLVVLAVGSGWRNSGGEEAARGHTG